MVPNRGTEQKQSNEKKQWGIISNSKFPDYNLQSKNEVI